MKLILRADTDLEVQKFRVMVDWSNMAKKANGMPTGPMSMYVHIEGGASTNRLDIRENKILKKLPEQYEHMKTLVRLARVFGFKARREEHMPLFSMGKADKYVIASVNAGVFLDKKREIELINAVLLAGTYWPYEHMDYTGYMIEYAKTLVISDIDAPREIELAHTLTETLDIFGLNIQTGVICPSMDT